MDNRILKIDDLEIVWTERLAGGGHAQWAFERLQAERRDMVRAEGAIPATGSRSMGESDDACRNAVKAYLAETGTPDLDAPPVGIVAPHQHYNLAWALRRPYTRAQGATTKK